MAESVLTMAPISPEPEQKIFKAAILGFKRDDVLSYISSLNKASSDLATELNCSIEYLKNNLNLSESSNQELSGKNQQLENHLQQVTAKSVDLEEQVQALRLDNDRANDEAASYKSRLFASSQEITMLKADNARLNSSINVLNATISNYEALREEHDSMAEAALLQANKIRLKAAEEAKLVRDKASDDAVVLIAAAEKEKNEAKQAITASAQSIAISVGTIKSELSAVDAKIASAISDLNHLTSNISNALANTESDLNALGAQLSSFPEISSPIKATAQKHVVNHVVEHIKKPDNLSQSILSRLAKLLR